jgi:hypothetical protein
MATMDSVRAIATLKKAASEMINFFDCPLGQLVDSEEMSRHGGECLTYKLLPAWIGQQVSLVGKCTLGARSDG